MISIRTNNYYNGEYIVSYDPKKTWIKNYKNSYIFCKKTNIKEVKTMNLILKLLKNKSILMNDKKYNLKIPKILKWDEKEKILYMEYCGGKNLEFYLRNYETHEEGKEFLNNLLNFFISNKIYWADFAPRNIIIDTNNIYIVDFEKGLLIEDTKLIDFLRNHVYEEYCLFLLKKEREEYEENIFSISDLENMDLYLESLNPGRIYQIAKLLGYKDKITKQQCLNILKMIIEVEEPILKNKNYIFPGVILDRIIVNKNSSNSIVDYSKEIIRLYNEKHK